MAYIVDFKNVSTIGLESSPVAKALAGFELGIALKSQFEFFLFLLQGASSESKTCARFNG
ncbi:hypothetical protein GCM10020370_39340 [Paenibacillus hodogayensis]